MQSLIFVYSYVQNPSLFVEDLHSKLSSIFCVKFDNYGELGAIEIHLLCVSRNAA